jgi:hypothetical protein
MQGKGQNELREDKGKSKGRTREERVGKALPEILSHFVCPLHFPLSSLTLPWRS